MPPKTDENEHHSFVRAILYAIRYQKNKKMNICDKNYFKQIIDEELIHQFDEEKYDFILDLQNFNNNCYEINCFLSKYRLFLRVFELRSKFRHLTLEEPKN